MQTFKFEDGVLIKYYGDMKQILMANDVVEIGSDAFSSCVSLTEVRLSKNLKKINSGTFSTCPKLTRVLALTTDIEIEDGAFAGCSELDAEALEMINKINPNALV